MRTGFRGGRSKNTHAPEIKTNHYLSRAYVCQIFRDKLTPEFRGKTAVGRVSKRVGRHQQIKKKLPHHETTFAREGNHIEEMAMLLVSEKKSTAVYVVQRNCANVYHTYQWRGIYK